MTKLATCPFVFLHVPKTAGTSILAALGNVFGEERVRRLGPGELHMAAIEALLDAPELAQIGCLAGHMPAHAFGERLREFPVFTLLRHPVDRVFSLFRFLRRQPASELTRLDLRENFGFDEFLACRAQELAGQIRNGMCDQLCNLPTQRDRTYNGFWEQTPLEKIVAGALATLQGATFGLAEAMPDTLLLLRATLGVPFELAEMFENASGPAGAEWTPANILRVIELNAGDLALYHAAATLFRARVAALRAAAPGAARTDGLARLERGVTVPIRAMAGRQGFFPYEPAGDFSWVIGAQPARIAFVAAPGGARLRIRLYHVTDAYPAGEIGVEVNGAGVAAQWQPEGGKWGVLETAPFDAAEMNAVTLTVPYALPVRFLAPGSNDPRQLSVAVATVTLVGD